MGERARTALDILLSATPSLRGSGASHEDLFLAAVRVLMRMVVLFHAESRRLLPVQNQVYATSYSLTRLTRILDETRWKDGEALSGRRFAWPRIVALFALVYEGSPHPGLPVRAYGGELFEPGQPEASGVSGPLALLEQSDGCPDDEAVADILTLLSRIGRGKSRGKPVDFGRLPGDYLGTIYEALLDCRLEKEPTWQLVRSGGERKNSGSYYTPAALAERVVEHTLAPLCYADSSPVPQPPDEILALRVCDPAMGSGAFLVAALRYLTRALREGVGHHGLTRPLVSGGVAIELGPVCIELPEPPGAPGSDSLLEAHIRRHVVERCIYGVDRDPVTVELARIALWLETMDQRLPFTFLDHKLKVGDSLVGAWFHDLEVYPLQAWRRAERSGRGIRRDRDNGQFAERAQMATAQASSLAAQARSPLLPLPGDIPRLPVLRRSLARTMEGLFKLPVQFPDRKREHYRTKYLRSDRVRSLRAALDRWCALWFWPAQSISCAPLPDEYFKELARPGGPAAAIAARERFFHWELEFPEVFAARDKGFDALLGNPPWDTLKGDRSLSNWFSHVKDPAGPLEGALRRAARGRGRRGREAKRPYRLQGRSDFNTHKLFLEQALHLTRERGRLGFLLPGGLYSDRGCSRLREELLDRCRWEWLFAFENRKRIFPIDGRFRFAAVVASKGERTESVRTAFMQQLPEAWVPDSKKVFDYPVELLSLMSPVDRAFMEVTSPRQLELMKRMSSNGVALAGRGRGSWRVRYRREIDAGLKPVSGPGQPSLPLYRGEMVGQFDCTAAAPTRFMNAADYAKNRNARLEPKVVVRRITNATNTRTVIAALVPGYPCNDKVPVLTTGSAMRDLSLLALLNSVAFDYAARTLCTTANLDWHLLGRIPLPPVPEKVRLEELALAALRLCGGHPAFASLWLEMKRRRPELALSPWQSWWAESARERLASRVFIDVQVARAYGLTAADMEFILTDCGHPIEKLRTPAFTSDLDPRGFWRVDRERPPHLRLPVQVLECFKSGEEMVQPAPSPRLSGLDWEDCRRLAKRSGEVMSRHGGAHRKGASLLPAGGSSSAL